MFQRLHLAPRLAALLVQGHEDVDLALHGIDIERLVQEVDGAAFIALEGEIHFLAGRRDEDDGDVARLLRAAHQLRQLKTIHFRHLHVEDGQREIVLQQQGQRLFARGGLVDAAVALADQRIERAQVFRQIVDDQQFGACFIHHVSFLACAVQRNGKRRATAHACGRAFRDPAMARSRRQSG